MAGELAIGVATKSGEWTATADAVRGDVIDLGKMVGFLLSDVKKDGIAAVGTQSKLPVELPQPSTPQAWKAFDVVGWHRGEIRPNVLHGARYIGYVHHDVDATQRVPVVWDSRPEQRGWRYHMIANEMTTPKFGVTRYRSSDRSGGTSDFIDVPNSGYVRSLWQGNSKGIVQDVPIVIDYEGDLLAEPHQRIIFGFDVGYRLWRGDNQKQVTVWRTSFREGRGSGGDTGISMDSFSNKSVLSVGQELVADRTSDPANPILITVTDKDFEDGIDTEVLLRIRTLDETKDPGLNIVAPTAKTRRLYHLEITHAQMVVHQS